MNTAESSPAAEQDVTSDSAAIEETVGSSAPKEEEEEAPKPKDSRRGGPIYLIDIKNNTVRAFRKAAMAGGAQADDYGNQIMVGRLEDMDKVPVATLVALYNTIRPENPIKKFADRATANKRMFPALEVLAGKIIEGGKTDVATKTKTKTAAKKTTTGGTKKERTTTGGAGRESTYAGKVITKLVDENPRREGTAGFKSFAVIKNGMTYEQYIAKGGRRKDLAWDEAHKYVKVSKA